MKKVSKRNLNMAGMAIVTIGLIMSGLSTNYGFMSTLSYPSSTCPKSGVKKWWTLPSSL